MDEIARSTRINGPAWLFVIAPVIFLVQFSAIYGFNALACSFQWTTTRLFGLPLVPVAVAAVTLVAIAALLVAMPSSRIAENDRGVDEDGNDDEDDRDEGAFTPDDPQAAQRFVVGATRLVCLLSAGGMLVIALPTLMSPPC